MALSDTTSTDDLKKTPSSPSSHPSIKSLSDLQIIECSEGEAREFLYTTFFHITSEEEVYFGESPKSPREITLSEYGSALRPIKDEEIYPELPIDISLKIAPESLDNVFTFIKRPGLIRYEETRGTDRILNNVLHETLIMEQVFKLHHPNIIKYHGCRVRRGRITGLVLERLPFTLAQYAIQEPTLFQQRIDGDKFIKALESVVEALHERLGVAHNDINLQNIMVREVEGGDGGLEPVLIDFGSCRPFGDELLSLGTKGWTGESLFYTSKKENDRYPLVKLREWLRKPE